MKKIKPKVSIIFPTYNGEYFLSRNLESISNLKSISEIEIIIIDNNSQDSSVKIIKNYFNRLNLKIFQNKENQGFVRACNKGALEARGEFIFITNQDVIFPENFFIELLKIYEIEKKNNNIVISPSLIFENDGIHYFGAKIHFLGFSYTPNIGDPLPKLKVIKRTERFSGGTLFMKRDTFLKMEGFDKRLFMYYEDTDLSLRLLRKGLKMYTTSQPFLIHQKHELTFNDFRYFLLERNRYIIFCKNINGFKSLIPIFLITEFILLIQSIIIRKFKIRIRVYYEIIREFKDLKKIRNQSRKEMPLIPYQNLSNSLDPILMGDLKNNHIIQKFFNLFNNLLKYY